MSNRIEYKIYRAKAVLEALGVLKETIDRRLSPDEVIDSKVETLELEVTLLIKELQKEK